MLKISELKSGDVVKVMDDGVEREGIITGISHSEHLAQVNNGVQEFWYNPEKIFPILITDQHLMKMGFEKEELPDASIKYKKGAFRLLTNKKDDFSNIEMWYREDRRHFNFPIGVHQLQNLHLQMTKVPLDMPA
jgi:hypothetical protein